MMCLGYKTTIFNTVEVYSGIFLSLTCATWETYQAITMVVCLSKYLNQKTKGSKSKRQFKQLQWLVALDLCMYWSFGTAFIIGPIKGSVFIRDCKECNVSVACS